MVIHRVMKRYVLLSHIIDTGFHQAMALFLLDHGAGNVQSLANSISKLGYEFSWISTPADFDKASVCHIIYPTDLF